MERLAGREIQVWRQDNAGENKVLEKNMIRQHWKMKTKFEYTASGTPQQNLYTKMRFTALADMSCVMMNKVSIPGAICYNLFGKVSKTATKLDSVVIVEVNGVKKMLVEHYAKKIPHWVEFMRTFDKAGTVRTEKDDKVSKRGVAMMVVGYADNHEGGCY